MQKHKLRHYYNKKTIDLIVLIKLCSKKFKNDKL